MARYNYIERSNTYRGRALSQWTALVPALVDGELTSVRWTIRRWYPRGQWSASARTDVNAHHTFHDAPTLAKLDAWFATIDPTRD